VPNERLDGITVIVVMPVPERATVCGELDAWSVIERLPEKGPVAPVGVNVALIVQDAPASNWFPQLLT
jgi:hypothetical protein